MLAISITLLILLIIANKCFKYEQSEKQFYKSIAIEYGRKVHRGQSALSVERMLERKRVKGL